MACGLYYEIYRDIPFVVRRVEVRWADKENEPQQSLTAVHTHRRKQSNAQTQLTKAQNHKRNADALTVVARI